MLQNPISETTNNEVILENSIESNRYISVRRFWQAIFAFLGLSNVWTGVLNTFNSITAKQVYTTKQTFVITGADPVQAVNLDNGSYIVLDLTSAIGTLNLSLNNGRVGGSYIIQVIQAITKVDITLVNEGRLDGGTGNTIEGIDNKDYIIVPFCTGTGFIINTGGLT